MQNIEDLLAELQNYDPNTPSDLNRIKQIQTSIFPSNIPTELTDSSLPFWLLWTPTAATLKDGTPKILKIPSAGATWQKRTKVYNYILNQRNSITENEGTRGLGFIFTDNHPYIVIDIDSLETKDNLALIEYSPGLKGVHVWVKVLTSEVKKQFEVAYGRKQLCKKVERDLFISSGYVTVTGCVPDPLQIKPINIFSYDDLFDILRPYFEPKLSVLPTPKHTSSKTDKKTKKASDAMRTADVRNLLNKIDVRTLTDDIFTQVFSATDLAILDPDEREEARGPWLTICQGVHHNFKGHRYGLQLLHEWSERGNKYDDEALNSVYESFTVDPQYTTGRNVVTIGSLISLVNAQAPTFLDVKQRGGPLPTLDNLIVFLEFYKFQFKYNTVALETETVLPSKIYESLKLPSKPTF